VVSLLDTCTLLWTLATPDRLSRTAKRSVASGEVVLSVVSYWEVVIKARKGILPIPDPVVWWTRATQFLGSNVLPVRPSHITALASLPDLHRDPFDRMLVAQAVAEGLSVVTSDERIRAYPVRVLW
jgi:PIN domain nuclease of toxin-antitoxin system